MTSRVLGNYVGVILASIVGVVVVLAFEAASRSYSSLTLVVALFTFSAVVSASLMIAWAAEASEFLISRGLALAIVAMVQTLPEFFVEGTIAWNAGQNPASWIPLVTANFTGANRLLTGLGWPLILFVALLQRRRNGVRDGRRSLVLRNEQSVEVVFMFAASIYYGFVWVRGALDLLDTVVLMSIFAVYLLFLSKLPSEGGDSEALLDPSPGAIVKLRPVARLGAILALFVFSGLVFVLITEPFVTSIKTIGELVLGAGAGYFFIQWIAPFLSEFPEKVTALHWASKVTLAPMALLNFISSAVNELTALVAIIPIVFVVSFGAIAPVSLISHRDEILLTMGQSLYACASLLDLELNVRNAVTLFGLWLFSTAFIETRFIVAVIFLALTLIEVVVHGNRTTTFSHFRATVRQYLLRHS